MFVEQQIFKDELWKKVHSDSGFEHSDCSLVLVFGEKAMIKHPIVFSYLKGQYPKADIVFSSTSGEILGEHVYDNSISVTAIVFEKTEMKSVVANIKETGDSYATGLQIMKQLYREDLVSVLVFSDGNYVNGSELVAGLNKDNAKKVPVTGGLAGDGYQFKTTLTGLNSVPDEGNVIGIGFYGDNLIVGHGSVGGWDEFGHERMITKSDKNVLYEINGKSALSLYKEYLGDYVNGLPGSALLFPLSLKMDESDGVLVRTILALDEENDSMTFAGNMPEGSKVRLMKANFDRIITASSSAAQNSFFKEGAYKPDLAILISCVGRKLILQQRINEEVEAAKEILGDNVPICGFYSYGELSPLKQHANCELHNQTMTILTMTEK